MTTIDLTRVRAAAQPLLTARPGMLADFYADRAGFLGAQLVRLPHDEWLDILTWQSSDDLAASRARGADRPGIAGFFAAIDEMIGSEDGTAADSGTGAGTEHATATERATTASENGTEHATASGRASENATTTQNGVPA